MVDRTTHRKVPNRARELRERGWALVEHRLAGKSICGRCGCTLASYADKCTANLDERCPGFEVIDIAKMGAEQEVGLS